MHLRLVLCLSVGGLCSAFFLFHEKGKPPIFCFKICPLYCPKHATERHDYDYRYLTPEPKARMINAWSEAFFINARDASHLTYSDYNPYVTAEASAKYDHFTPTWKTKTPKPTKAPTSQKPYLDYNPYLIEGSGDYDHPSYYEHWTQSTQKPITTEAPETTTELIYLDHNPYSDYELDDYDYHTHYEHWKPKSTPKTTTTTKASTTTTEKTIHFDYHPYFIEEWSAYEDHPIHYHSWKPTTMPTTTTAPTTTKESTFICQVCEAKCGHKS